MNCEVLKVLQVFPSVSSIHSYSAFIIQKEAEILISWQKHIHCYLPIYILLCRSDLFSSTEFFYLPPVDERCGWEIIKHLPYVCLSVHLSHFYINDNISFIYKDIFTKFEGNVYGL